MKILAIETSCDETGIALLDARGGLTKPRFEVLENFVASQIKIHAPFGGVVPNLAKREHLKTLPLLFKKLLMACSSGSEIKNEKLKVDAIAVTIGPGLEPALWTGITFAKTLAHKFNKPIIGANHLEGHLYSFLLPGKKKTIISHSHFLISKKIFPAIALIVSGGHTILLLIKSFSSWKKLGETRDDAVGEAFDKVARIAGLPYPGGPEIERMAKSGDAEKINFPRPMMRDKNYDFSFSGLKTAVLYRRRDYPKERIADVAASFQKAAVDVLVYKTIQAAKEYGVRSLLLSGGVAANKFLARSLAKSARGLRLNFLIPGSRYNLDNAAMIGAAGYFAYLRNKKYKLSAQGNLGI